MKVICIILILAFLVICGWMEKPETRRHGRPTITDLSSDSEDLDFVEVYDCDKQADTLHSIELMDLSGNVWYCDPSPGLNLSYINGGACFADREPEGSYVILMRLHDECSKQFDAWCSPRIGKSIGIAVDGKLVIVARLEGILNGHLVIRNVGDSIQAESLAKEIRRRAERIVERCGN